MRAGRIGGRPSVAVRGPCGPAIPFYPANPNPAPTPCPPPAPRCGAYASRGIAADCRFGDKCSFLHVPYTALGLAPRAEGVSGSGPAPPLAALPAARVGAGGALGCAPTPAQAFSGGGADEFEDEAGFLDDEHEASGGRGGGSIGGGLHRGGDAAEGSVTLCAWECPVCTYAENDLSDMAVRGGLCGSQGGSAQFAPPTAPLAAVAHGVPPPHRRCPPCPPPAQCRICEAPRTESVRIIETVVHVQ